MASEVLVVARFGWNGLGPASPSKALPETWRAWPVRAQKKNISWRYGSHGPFSSMIHHDLLNLNIVVFHSYVELPGGKWPSYFDVSGVEDKTIWCLWNHVESKWDLGFGIDASESMPGSWVFKHIGSVSLKLSSPNYLDGFSKRPLILKQVLWSAPNLASSAP